MHTKMHIHMAMKSDLSGYCLIGFAGDALFLLLTETDIQNLMYDIPVMVQFNIRTILHDSTSE